MIELSTDSAVLFAHVVAAVVLLGGSLFAPLTRAAIRSAGSLRDLRLWLDFARRSARANPAAALVLLASGLFLGSQGWWQQAWFYVAAGAWVVNVLLAALVIQRLARSLGQAAARAGEGPIGEEIDALRSAPAWDVAADLMLGNDLAILYVMMNKPSLADTLTLLAIANLALAAARLARRRRSGRRLRFEHRPATEEGR